MFYTDHKSDSCVDLHVLYQNDSFSDLLFLVGHKYHSARIALLSSSPDKEGVNSVLNTGKLLRI